MMESATVVVVSADGALRRALVSRLSHALGLSVDVRSELAFARRPVDSEILVVPAAELPPARCRELANEGFHVIVLAALPREIDQQAYRAAGAAAYVTMTVDPAPLVDAITRTSAVLSA